MKSIYPTAEEVKAHRAIHGCGLMTSKDVLITQNIQDWLSVERTADELRCLLLFLVSEGRI